MAFRRAMLVDELWSGEMRSVELRERRVLLVNRDGAVRAYEDRCPHMSVPLSEGRLDRNVLTCSAHHWQFNVCTGRGVNPCMARLVAFPVALDAGQILVDIDAPAAVTPSRQAGDERPLREAGAAERSRAEGQSGPSCLARDAGPSRGAGDAGPCRPDRAPRAEEDPGETVGASPAGERYAAARARGNTAEAPGRPRGDG